MRLHAPQTLEGAQVWQLVLRIGGQLRTVGERVIGYDMTAVLMMAAAQGVPAWAVAEYLPGIEAQMVLTANKRGEGAGEVSGLE